MEVGDRDRALSLWPNYQDGRVQSKQCDAHVGRIGRDAVLTRAQNRVIAVEAVNRGTPRAWRAFVARSGRIVEIRAARPLHEIPAHRGHVAQLSRSPSQNRL